MDEVYNIGTDKEKSVREVAHDVLCAFGISEKEHSDWVHSVKDSLQ